MRWRMLSTLKKRILLFVIATTVTTLTLFYIGLPELGSPHSLARSKNRERQAFPLPVLHVKFNGRNIPRKPLDKWNTTVIDKLKNNISKTVDRINNRLQNVADACSEIGSRETGSHDNTGKLLVLREQSLVFCPVPGAGSTNWKRRLISLTKKTNTRAETSHRLSRLQIQNSSTFFEKASINSTADLDMVEPGFNVMFTRDPYSRLWFSYLDRLYLPPLWSTLGVEIIRTVKLRPKPLSLKCGFHVNFEDVLQFIVRTKGKTPYGSHEYFESVHSICEPCKVKYDFIGKIETFDEDAELVEALVRTGNDTSEDDDDDVAKLIRDLVDYNFDILDKLERSNGQKNECLDLLEVARRVWVVLQYKGYLGDERKFPREQFRGQKDRWVVRELLKEILFTEITSASDETKQHWRHQRQASLERAYKIASKRSILAIQKMFALDFQLFGYDLKPDWLYD